LPASTAYVQKEPDGAEGTFTEDRRNGGRNQAFFPVMGGEGGEKREIERRTRVPGISRP